MGGSAIERLDLSPDWLKDAAARQKRLVCGVPSINWTSALGEIEHKGAGRSLWIQRRCYVAGHSGRAANVKNADAIGYSEGCRGMCSMMSDGAFVNAKKELTQGLVLDRMAA